ncbi:hypothetical protein O181_060309 [Austropuccinia psidii MF-1]|uniref:Uncharacterized protein n=1 Tax=Austropuccinia psidii MF-1 TaxID=1389203 RepID=A0A9Q3EG43_9BASI|nr:hypothetical protein [Austropuccinia psidii MF-1]
MLSFLDGPLGLQRLIEESRERNLRPSSMGYAAAFRSGNWLSCWPDNQIIHELRLQVSHSFALLCTWTAIVFVCGCALMFSSVRTTIDHYRCRAGVRMGKKIKTVDKLKKYAVVAD